ncbi:MAG: glycoside hydrolase family 88 protein [Kiritimatiellae bacterium]|nr:glycoside hydrolase family 88 protein [Kiritimatiellia bacterium]
MKKRLFLIGSVLTLSGFAQDSALANLKSRLPEIFSACAAHYKALDAAVTPLMKNAKGQTMVPHGYKRGKKMYDMRRIEWWTSGHFPGSLWYLYEATGDGFFKERASVWTENLKPISTYKGNHDIGFMMYCSFGNARRLLKTEKYDHLLVEAANTLCLRFEPELGLIRSWGKTDDKKDFLVIPDNMMNLELLEWAAKAKNGEKRFAEVARSHADVTMKNHFRTDGGTYHVLNYSQKDLRVQEIRRGQGASCFTAWSRGQSWAIYGYTMMYRESGDKAYLDFAQKVADFAINHPNMPEDGIPY